MEEKEFSAEARSLIKAAYNNYNHLTLLKPEGETLRYVAGTEILAPDEDKEAKMLKKAMEEELLSENIMKKKTDTIVLTKKGISLAETLLENPDKKS